MPEIKLLWPVLMPLSRAQWRYPELHFCFLGLRDHKGASEWIVGGCFSHLPLPFVEQSTQFLLTCLRQQLPEAGEKELGGLLDERQREVRKAAASQRCCIGKPGL